MDINRILFLVAILNLGGDLYNVYRYRDRLPKWMKVLVVGAFCTCSLSWLFFNELCGFISAGILLGYVVIMRIHSRRVIGKSSRPSPATKALIALNCLGYLIQMYYQATSDLEVLVNLGAFYGPFFEKGEWWRLLTSQFLHLGVLHLACNMLGLSFLGPAAENALGWWKFLLGYVVSGAGGMLIAWGFYSVGWSDSAVVLVGASAGVLGLVGLSGASSLMSYRSSGSPMAKAQLTTMAQIVILQIIFDAMVPEVSSTAHLGGAATGFFAGLLLSWKRRARSLE